MTENTFISLVPTVNGRSTVDGILITLMHVLVPTGTFHSDIHLRNPKFFSKNFLCRPMIQGGHLPEDIGIENQLIIETGLESPVAVVTVSTFRSNSRLKG